MPVFAVKNYISDEIDFLIIKNNVKTNFYQWQVSWERTCQAENIAQNQVADRIGLDKISGLVMKKNRPFNQPAFYPG
jgi:hypothetical protein